MTPQIRTHRSNSESQPLNHQIKINPITNQFNRETVLYKGARDYLSFSCNSSGIVNISICQNDESHLMVTEVAAQKWIEMYRDA
jgi:hypothetical protein